MRTSSVLNYVMSACCCSGVASSQLRATALCVMREKLKCGGIRVSTSSATLAGLPVSNGFSKKLHNHECAVAMHYMFYNFGRIHKTLRVTPAMEAGVADQVWSLEEIAKPAD